MTPSPPHSEQLALALGEMAVLELERVDPFELDLSILHEAIRPWVSPQALIHETDQPKQETAQLFHQLKEHGFSCHLRHYIGRTPLTSRAGTSSTLTLTLIVHCQGLEFDAIGLNPMERMESYCQEHEIPWTEGDEVDQMVGSKMVQNHIEMAQSAPNVGLYRSIEAALSEIQRNSIDQSTAAAHGTKASGRL